MQQTPFVFQTVKLAEDISFFVQSFFVNGVQYTRLIVVDADTRNSVASLPGLENHKNYYCEVGALTEFIGINTTTFSYIDPTTFDTDHNFVSNTALKLFSDAYLSKRELFVTALTGYQTEYMKNAFHARQLLCDWMEWVKHNIMTQVIWIPISQFIVVYQTDLTATDTVVNSSERVADQYKITKIEPKNTAPVTQKTYASVAAAAASRVIPSKKTSTNPSVVSYLGFNASEQTDQKPVIERKQASKLDVKNVATKAAPLTKIKSPFHNAASSYNKFSFSPLSFDGCSSDDESDDDNVQSVKSSPPKLVPARKKAIIKKNSKRDAYDEDKFLDELYALAKLATDQEKAAQELLNATPIVPTKTTAGKSAAEQAEERVMVMTSMIFLLMSPTLTHMLHNIVHQSWNDLKAYDTNISKELIFLGLLSVYASQLVCTVYSVSIVGDKIIDSFKNHRQMLFGYQASKRNESVKNVAAIENTTSLRLNRG